MARDIDSERFSETQRAILRAVLENPSLSNAEVAAETGARITLVRDTRETYADEVTLSEGETATDQSGSGKITDAQQAILQTVSANPSLTNAAVAKKTGTRIALVRDTRDKHGAEYVPPDGSATDGDDEDAVDDLNEAQEAIIAAAATDPSRTNSEIAEHTGTRIALVRDTRTTYAAKIAATADDEAGDDDAERDDDTASAGGLTAAQRKIIQAAEDDPTRTNADIADLLDVRIATVRDTRDEFGAPDERSDDATESAKTEPTADEPVDVNESDVDESAPPADESASAAGSSSSGSAGPSGGAVLVLILILFALLAAGYIVALERGLI